MFVRSLFVNLFCIKFILFFAFTLALANPQIRTDRLLFCLNKNYETISINNNSEKVETNYDKLNTIIKSYQINQIEPWLPAASNNDYDGEIYLNRIYRLSFSSRSIPDIKMIKNYENP